MTQTLILWDSSKLLSGFCRQGEPGTKLSLQHTYFSAVFPQEPTEPDSSGSEGTRDVDKSSHAESLGWRFKRYQTLPHHSLLYSLDHPASAREHVRWMQKTIFRECVHYNSTCTCPHHEGVHLSAVSWHHMSLSARGHEQLTEICKPCHRSIVISKLKNTGNSNFDISHLFCVVFWNGQIYMYVKNECYVSYFLAAEHWCCTAWGESFT